MGMVRPKKGETCGRPASLGLGVLQHPPSTEAGTPIPHSSFSRRRFLAPEGRAFERPCRQANESWVARMFWLPAPTDARPRGPPFNHLAPAFTPAVARIGILGVRPRLQQRDCPRLTRGSSRHQQVGMFNARPIPGKGNCQPRPLSRSVASTDWVCESNMACERI